jgi:hypothetical protein
VRYTNTENHYLVIFNATSATLYERTTDSYTQVGTPGTITMAVDTWYDFKVQLDGASIKVWFDGTLEIDTTDSSHASGKVALSASGGTDAFPAYFTDIRTRPYVDADPTAAEGSEESDTYQILPTQLFLPASSNDRHRAGVYAGTPVGYHTLGRVYPRGRLREYEITRSRMAVHVIAASPPSAVVYPLFDQQPAYFGKFES